jgi:hypothetical protein
MILSGKDETKANESYQSLSKNSSDVEKLPELTLEEALELIPFGKFHIMFGQNLISYSSL